MAKRRTRLGDPVAVRKLRQGGYPDAGGRLLKDGQGNVVAKGFRVGCTKLRPGAPGAWIDNIRCTYNFKFPDPAGGKWYACRGYGDGIAVSCRRMKKPPRRR